MSRSAQAAVIIAVMNPQRLLGFGRETVIANQFGATYLPMPIWWPIHCPIFCRLYWEWPWSVLLSRLLPDIWSGEKRRSLAYCQHHPELDGPLHDPPYSVRDGRSPSSGYGYGPGFDQPTRDLAALLTIIMFPSVVFMGAGMLITGILNARKSFAVAAFAPGFSSLIIILSVLFLGDLGIEYLAWGTLLSFAGGFLIQVPALYRAGFSYKWEWSLKHPEVKGIFTNLLPIFLGTAVNQIHLAINRFFASGLAEGSISALNYSGKLMNLPMGIFALAISSAIFPTLSEQAVKDDRDALGKTLLKGLRMVLLVTIPASAGLMALKTPVVKLLFERGAFDQTATAMTAEALFYFALGMFAMAANMVITRAYYALRDVKTPLYLGLISIAVNIIFSIVLMPLLGHSGLALANTTAAVFVSATMYWGLEKAAA